MIVLYTLLGIGFGIFVSSIVWCREYDRLNHDWAEDCFQLNNSWSDFAKDLIHKHIAYEEEENELKPRTGKWLKTGQSFVNPNKFRNYCCSECGWELDEHIRTEPHYCQNCGAKME